MQRTKLDLKTLVKLYKFLVVGGISTIINYGTFAGFYRWMHWYYPVASVTGYVAGLFVGYLLNKAWTYRSHVEQGQSYFYKYLAVYLFSLGASTMLLMGFVEMNFFPPLISNIFAIVLSTIMNFIGTNYLVFMEKKPDAAVKIV
ncbi:MAG: GtrA family protein [SAR324 cluster bacterium]|nr:GtrA family protein [SAR324 cluster bacterium]